jgi:hypothetical protein
LKKATHANSKKRELEVSEMPRKLRAYFLEAERAAMEKLKHDANARLRRAATGEKASWNLATLHSYTEVLSKSLLDARETHPILQKFDFFITIHNFGVSILIN